MSIATKSLPGAATVTPFTFFSPTDHLIVGVDATEVFVGSCDVQKRTVGCARSILPPAPQRTVIRLDSAHPCALQAAISALFPTDSDLR